MPSHSVHTLPLFLLPATICLPCLFVPPIGFICISTRLLTCPCMSLASSIFQHNEVIDIRFKPTFVPCGHHLLFAFLLVSLLACWLAFLLLSHAMLDISILFVCFAPFCHYLRIFLSLLVYQFLVFSFACTHMERGLMELGHGLPSISKEGATQACRFEPSHCSQQVQGLAFPFGYVLF